MFTTSIAPVYGANIDTDLISLMKTHHVNVVGYAIIQDNQLSTANTISINPAIKPSTESLFQAASMSKALTAYATLTLVSQGKIYLDEPVNKQLQNWKIPHNSFSETITPRECLSMTSGLSYGDPGTQFGGYPQGAAVPTLDQILAGNSPATNPPVKACYKSGQCCAYSGTGFMVMQKLIEDKLAQPYVSLMQEQLLPALTMQHSTYTCPLSPTLKALAIPGFNADGVMLARGWDNIPAPGSGGLWSTPTDMAHFLIALNNDYHGKNNAFVSQALIKDMFTRQQHSIFGLGVVVDGDGKSLNIRKIGYNTGYYNLFIFFPQTGQGMVVMTDAANGITLIKEFVTEIAKRYQWPAYSPDFEEVALKNNPTSCAYVRA